MSAVEIKICGITSVEDALAAADAGAAMLGLNFYERSPRCISLERAQEIATAVGGRAKLVGVFVNMNVSEVLRVARAVPLAAVQLHGSETPEECATVAAEYPVIRALKVDAAFSTARAAEFAACAALLLDTACEGHGGSGRSFDWGAVDWAGIRAAVPGARLFLAGGLQAGNIAAAMSVARPDVVDVCSGVEQEKGIKSVNCMREFVAAVRAAEGQEQ